MYKYAPVNMSFCDLGFSIPMLENALNVLQKELVILYMSFFIQWLTAKHSVKSRHLSYSK